MNSKIAFVTWSGLQSFSEDDRLAVSALEARDVEVVAHPWDKPGVDWRAFDAVVIRSTWDYTRRLSEFLGWVARLELQGVRLLNPATVLLWNASKTYLRELEAEKISIVPTRWIKAGATSGMLEELRAVNWDRFVVKPAVSADGVRTHFWSRSELSAQSLRLAEIESALAEFEPGSVILVQPYLEEVAREGEWSLLFFGGEFSHAVLKRPGDGEFRVQKTYGGSACGAEPPEGSVAWARSVIAAAENLRGAALLYARVDFFVSEGRFLLGELEALEPSLFFAQDDAAPERFAEALMARIGQEG